MDGRSIRVLRGAACVAFCALVALLAIAPVRWVRGTVTNPAMAGIRPYDPLLHSHLIIRGTVEETQIEHREMPDWGFGPGGTMAAQKLRVHVVETLKGRWQEPTATIFALSGAWQFDPSKEYLFCAKWHETPKGRLLVGGTTTGIFVHDNNTWTRCDYMERTGETETFSAPQLAERIRVGNLPSVTDSAQVVAVGTIDSAWTSQYRASGGREGRMYHWRLRVSEWFKGRRASHSIEFSVPAVNATYVPKWYRDVPRGMRTGTEWLVFLKSGVRGLYPFGGPNSLLEVRGDELIYDSTAQYPMTLPEAKRAIESEIRHVED